MCQLVSPARHDEYAMYVEAWSVGLGGTGHTASKSASHVAADHVSCHDVRNRQTLLAPSCTERSVGCYVCSIERVQTYPSSDSCERSIRVSIKAGLHNRCGLASRLASSHLSLHMQCGLANGSVFAKLVATLRERHPSSCRGELSRSSSCLIHLVDLAETRLTGPHSLALAAWTAVIDHHRPSCKRSLVGPTDRNILSMQHEW